ncbi:MAG: TIGR04282 family arsenosugar biosynthesis glycosyltransferase, partial [Flavobacteriales bacterium]
HQILKTVEKSGIQYFHFSEKNQIGSSFGERFSNAIETIFNKGFKNVITIGNDTPHLKTHHLVDTLHQLEKSELVLGPSKDGGFYLMGIKKEHFNKETFLKLPWQTSRLQNCITSTITSKKLNIKFLETLNDLDVLEDIKKILHSFKAIPKSVLKFLILFITTKKEFFVDITINFKKTFSTPNSNKGSPLIFA